MLTRRNLFFLRKGDFERGAVETKPLSVPRQVFETLQLATVPVNARSFRWTLRQVPLPGSTLLVFYNLKDEVKRLRAVNASSKVGDSEHFIELELESTRVYGHGDSCIAVYWAAD